MNNKQLAEMIKHLRTQKLNEYQVRAGGTSDQLTKTPSGRNSAIDRRNKPLGGNDTPARYKPGIRAEEKEDKKIKAKNIINTTPEQDSAMIGTQ